MTKKLLVIAVVVVGLSAACGKPQPANETSASAPASGPVNITFKSDPDPARTGDNTFEAMVMQGGQPVNDATVSAEFFMPAMPAMKMPEMRSKMDLAPAGNGAYRGKGQVMMAGTWDVTVRAVRNGQELATQKVTVTAK